MEKSILYRLTYYVNKVFNHQIIDLGPKQDNCYRPLHKKDGTDAEARDILIRDIGNNKFLIWCYDKDEQYHVFTPGEFKFVDGEEPDLEKLKAVLKPGEYTEEDRAKYEEDRQKVFSKNWDKIKDKVITDFKIEDFKPWKNKKISSKFNFMLSPKGHLLIPAHDVETDELVGMRIRYKNGDKGGIKGSRNGRCYNLLQKGRESGFNQPILLVSESESTACVLAEVFPQFAVVHGFGMWNLKKLIPGLQKKFKNYLIVVCADKSLRNSDNKDSDKCYGQLAALYNDVTVVYPDRHNPRLDDISDFCDVKELMGGVYLRNYIVTQIYETAIFEPIIMSYETGNYKVFSAKSQDIEIIDDKKPNERLRKIVSDSFIKDFCNREGIKCFLDEPKTIIEEKNDGTTVTKENPEIAGLQQLFGGLFANYLQRKKKESSGSFKTYLVGTFREKIGKKDVYIHNSALGRYIIEDGKILNTASARPAYKAIYKNVKSGRFFDNPVDLETLPIDREIVNKVLEKISTIFSFKRSRDVLIRQNGKAFVKAFGLQLISVIANSTYLHFAPRGINLYLTGKTQSGKSLVTTGILDALLCETLYLSNDITKACLQQRFGHPEHGISCHIAGLEESSKPTQKEDKEIRSIFVTLRTNSTAKSEHVTGRGSAGGTANEYVARFTMTFTSTTTKYLDDGQDSGRFLLNDMEGSLSDSVKSTQIGDIIEELKHLGPYLIKAILLGAPYLKDCVRLAEEYIDRFDLGCKSMQSQKPEMLSVLLGGLFATYKVLDGEEFNPDNVFEQIKPALLVQLESDKKLDKEHSVLFDLATLLVTDQFNTQQLFLNYFRDENSRDDSVRAGIVVRENPKTKEKELLIRKTRFGLEKFLLERKKVSEHKLTNIQDRLEDDASKEKCEIKRIAAQKGQKKAEYYIYKLDKEEILELID